MSLAAVGFGIWDLAVFDLRYGAPLFVVLVGAVILIGAVTQSMRGHSEPGQGG